VRRGGKWGFASPKGVSFPTRFKAIEGDASCAWGGGRHPGGHSTQRALNEHRNYSANGCDLVKVVYKLLGFNFALFKRCCIDIVTGKFTLCSSDVVTGQICCVSGLKCRK